MPETEPRRAGGSNCVATPPPPSPGLVSLNFESSQVGSLMVSTLEPVLLGKAGVGRRDCKRGFALPSRSSCLFCMRRTRLLLHLQRAQVFFLLAGWHHLSRASPFLASAHLRLGILIFFAIEQERKKNESGLLRSLLWHSQDGPFLLSLPRRNVDVV